MEAILRRFTEGQKTRIVAFGSSNTERRIHGLHWFDWLDLGVKQTYGRVHHGINTGLGGDTSHGLLARFDEDVALYQPHVVFITIGGNDAKPDSGINAEDFHRNLHRLHANIRALDARAIFQTYYSADVAGLGPQHGSRFLAFMDVIRQVASETGAILVDHHRRWEPLRLRHFATYQQMMIDPLHVNALGNMVMGLDLLRVFRAALADEQRLFCAEGLHIQQQLDQLASQEF
jgi:acyl-CoA thioesterase-1